MNFPKSRLIWLCLALIFASCAKNERKSTMSLEGNKRIARQFYENVINKADYALASQILANNFWDHGDPPDQPKGVEGLKQFLSMITTAFPDIQVEIEDMLADENTVAVRLKVSGTQKGVLMGTIPPSGKHAVWSGMDFLKISEGKIVERWSVRDLLGLMQQIGAIKN